MIALFTVPDVSDLFASTGAWSVKLFTELLPIALIITGLIIGALFVGFLGRGVTNAVKSLVGGRRGGRRRR